VKKELIEAIKGIINTIDRNKYNISMGFFQKYSDAESDPKGVRFADIKLVYKDDNGEDISATVPLLQVGSKNSIYDFRLENGDELLVFFTDRTLEQWKDETGTEPQKLKNLVKDSINHGIAIPVCSHHNSALVTTGDLPSSVGLRIGVKSGKKAQVGSDTADDLKNLYDFMNIITNLSTTDGDSLAASLAAQKTNINNIIANQLTITEP
jgi:hypothetical protein